MGESVLVPGNQIPIFDIEGVRTAPTICYDLRFLEMYRRLALQNVDLFLVLSEWPCPRKVPLIVLAGARAIENQAFLLLSNRTAFDVDKQKFCGRSGLFGPLGTIGMMAEDEVGAMTFNLDFQLLSESREKLHVFSERRLGVDYE
jgi:predicted amidohydrolase